MSQDRMLMIYTPAISRDCVEYVAAEAAGHSHSETFTGPGFDQ